VNFHTSKDTVANAATVPSKKNWLDNRINVIATNAAVINNVIVG